MKKREKVENAVLSAIQNEADSLSKAERALNVDERQELIIQRTDQHAGIYAEMFDVDEAEFKAIFRHIYGINIGNQ